MSILRLRELAGYDVPTFFEYIKKGNVVKGNEVDLTEAEWKVIKDKYKGIYEGKNYYLTFENGMLAIIPVKTSFIGGIDNTLKQEKITIDTETVKDETTAVGDDPTKTAEEVIASVGEPQKTPSTSEPTSELGAETIKDGDVQEKKTEPEKVKESAEQKARKLIDIIKAGKRATSSKETQVDSSTKVGEPKDELGAASVKTCDLEDEKVTDGGTSVKESAEEVAKRIIDAVKAGNHPHDAKNAGDTATEKTETLDQNVDYNIIKNARPTANKETQVVQDKTGDTDRHSTKVEVPAMVTSQINQRIDELKSAQKEYDDKGFNGISVKQNAIDFLEKVKEHLADGSVEGLSHAQILFTTLMSPITDLLPAALINFLGTARNSLDTTGTKPEPM